MPGGLLDSFNKQTISQLLLFLPPAEIAVLSSCCQSLDSLLGPLKEWAFEHVFDTLGNVKKKAVGVRRISLCKQEGNFKDGIVCWDVPSEIQVAILGEGIRSRRTVVMFLSEGLRELYWSQDLRLPKLPSTLQVLVLDFAFRQALPRLPEGLVHLSIHQQFWDFPLVNLPSTLQYLQVGYGFNHPLHNLPTGLRHLRIASTNFNHEFEAWPSMLQSLKLPESYEHIIDHLPQSLTKLKCYSLPPTLPDSLKSLNLGWRELPAWLPPNLTSLKLPYDSVADFKEWPNNLTSLQSCGEIRSVENLPQSLRVLAVWKLESALYPMLSQLTSLDLSCTLYNWALTDLPHTLLHLFLPDVFNSELVLPSKLQTLSLRWNFDQPLENLPNSLIKIQLYGKFNHPLRLPQHLTSLEIIGLFNQPLEFPPGLVDLFLGDFFTHPVKLPSELRCFSVGHSFKHLLLDLPSSLIQCRLPQCNPTFRIRAKAPRYTFWDCDKYTPCKMEAKSPSTGSSSSSSSSFASAQFSPSSSPPFSSSAFSLASSPLLPLSPASSGSPLGTLVAQKRRYRRKKQTF